MIEIVSDLICVDEEARAYWKLKQFWNIPMFDCKMQEGIIVTQIFPLCLKALLNWHSAEIKNLNSFRALVRAIDYEVERQKEV